MCQVNVLFACFAIFVSRCWNLKRSKAKCAYAYLHVWFSISLSRKENSKSIFLSSCEPHAMWASLECVCVCVVFKSEWYWYAWVTHTDDAFERRRQTIAWHAPKTKTLNQFSFFLPSQIKWRRALTLLLLQTMFASFSNLSIFIERLLFSWPFLVSFNGELEIERHCINFNSISIRWRRNERQEAR